MLVDYQITTEQYIRVLSLMKALDLALAAESTQAFEFNIHALLKYNGYFGKISAQPHTTLCIQFSLTNEGRRHFHWENRFDLQ